MESEGMNNPAAAHGDLVALARARNATEMEPVLEFGPWWYPPVIAALLAGVVATAYAGPVGDSAIASVVVYVAFIGLIAYDAGRARVKPRMSRLTIASSVARALLVLSLAVGWMVVQSLLELDGWADWIALAIGWVVVTSILTAVRAGLGRWRRGVVATP